MKECSENIQIQVSLILLICKSDLVPSYAFYLDKFLPTPT